METRYYKAINTASGEILATRVKIAQDFRSRSTGLLNRDSLADDEGLLIKPCNSIHMFFMRFAIDAVFLDRQGKVVHIVEDLKPWGLASAMLKGFMVLELPSGKVKKSTIKSGNIIVFD